MKTTREIKAGDWVMYTDADSHRTMPRWYPAVGTVGRVVHVGPDTALVQWPAGSTSGNGCWSANYDDFVPTMAPRDVQRMQVMATAFCVAGMVMAVHVFRLLFMKLWFEAVCCCVCAAAALRKGMELDRRMRSVEGALAALKKLEAEDDDAEV